MLYNLFPSDLPCGKIFRGNIALRKSDKSAICHAATELQGKKTDMRMKPDWLNNSPMTNVEVATESSYIRCLAVPTLIERSDGQGIYCDISVREQKGMYVASDSLSSQVIKSTKWGLPTRRCRKAMSTGSENSAWQRSSRSSLSVGKPRTWRRGTAR